MVCGRLITCCKHALVHVLVRTDAIDGQKEKGNGEEEPKDDANVLNIKRDQCWEDGGGAVINVTFNSENFVSRTMVLTSTPSDF